MTTEQKVTWLTGGSHFVTHGYMTLLPGVLVVIAGEQSMSFTDIGVIANIGYFLYGLGSFPAGHLADRLGSKRILTFGVFGMAIASILVGLAPGTLGFALSYALLGACASIHHPAGMSFIARRVARKGKALGVHGVLGNIGLTLSPLVAGFCVKLFGTWRAAYLLYGGLGLLFALVFAWTKVGEGEDVSWQDFFSYRGGPEALTSGGTPEATEPETRAVIPLVLLLLYMASILSGFIFRGSLTFFPALFQREVSFIAGAEQPVVMAGYVTTAVLSLGLIGSWFGGYLNDKLKTPECIPVIIFIVTVPTLFFISRLNDTGLIAMGALFSLFYYGWQPSQNYLIAKYTKRASHGKGFGVSFFLIFGMGSVATAVGGYVADNFGVDLFYRIMAMVGMAALFTALAVFWVRPYSVRLSWAMVKEKQ